VVVSLTGAVPSIQELLPALPCGGQESSNPNEEGLARARARTALETHAGRNSTAGALCEDGGGKLMADDDQAALVDLRYARSVLLHAWAFELPN
jgi:hypothetical protein